MTPPRPNIAPEPKRSFARFDRYDVLLIGSIACPHCDRLLRASDVIAFADLVEVTLICGGCHEDVLVIRNAE